MANTYTALQGNQLAKAIVHDVQKALADHPACSPAIGHHDARYTVKIHIESHPFDVGRVHDLEVKGQAGQGEPSQVVKDALVKDDAGSPKLVAGELPTIAREIVRPNELRAEIGLPIEDPQEISPGNIADLPAGQTPFD